MSRVIRFAYVFSPTGKVAHMANGAVDGDRTYCGIAVHKPWRFHTVGGRLSLRRCARCVAAK